jgi:hypothetical protein
MIDLLASAIPPRTASAIFIIPPMSGLHSESRPLIESCNSSQPLLLRLSSATPEFFTIFYFLFLNRWQLPYPIIPRCNQQTSDAQAESFSSSPPYRTNYSTPRNQSDNINIKSIKYLPPTTLDITHVNHGYNFNNKRAFRRRKESFPNNPL